SKALAQSAQAFGFGPDFRRTQAARDSETDDERNRQGAATHAALMAAAVEEGLEPHVRIAAAHIESTDAFRSIHFMGGQAEQVDMQSLNIKRNLAGSLGRVGVQ